MENIVLALRLRSRNYAFELKEELHMYYGCDVSEILEWTTVALLTATLAHWDLFDKPASEAIGLMNDDLTRHLKSLPLSVHQVERIRLRLFSTLSRFYDDLHTQIDPIVNLLGLEAKRIRVVRQDMHSITLFLEETP